MPVPIEALLFDLGGVVIEIDQRRTFAAWARQAGRAIERVDAHHGSAAAFLRHEVGAISDADFFAALRHSLGLDLTDAQLLEGWNAMLVGEMAGIRPLLGRLSGRLPMFVFSNTNAAHEEHWSARFAEVLAHFDKLYVSNRLGLRKPERAAFEAVVRDMGVPASRVLFFDDRADNVEGARASGLEAVQVACVDDIERALADRGI
jgi:putative hydrolase of the HAD superfamily